MEPHRPSAVRSFGEGLAVAVAYAALGWLGLQLASVGHTVTLIWPPSGIALAALTLRGPRLAWAVLLGAVYANLAVGGSLIQSSWIGLGNTTGAVLGALVLHSLGFEPRFSRRRDVTSLLAGAVVSASAAALVGSTVVMATHEEGRSFANVFAHWCAGDVLGIMVVAPTLFVWSTRTKALEERAPIGGLSTLLGSALVMMTEPFRGPASLPFTVVPLLVLVWIALRSGPRWTATANLLVCTIVVVGTQLGAGPFAGPDTASVVPIVGMFLGLSAFLSAMLTAITAETRSAEAALEEREARFRGAFEHAPFGMVILEPNGTITAANLCVGSILNVDSASLVGRSIGESVMEADRASLLARVRDFAVGAETTAEVECSVRGHDGELRKLHARLGRTQVGESADSILMQIEDVTGWRRAEAERSALALQLAQAQRLDSIGQLAGGVAHDFNNVLQAIAGSLALLGDPRRSAEQRKALIGTAMGAVDRAAALVRQLLDFSRRDPGEQRVFDLRDLVASTARILARLMPADVRLTTRFDARPCNVRADWTQLDQLVLNLCVNARDALAGSGNIEVSVENVPGERPSIRLEVTDDGSGIPDALRERVFEPFFTTKEPGKGTGLGLSVVYGVVQRHQGTITLADRPGGGTRVIVDLPMAKEEPAKRPAPSIAPAPRGGTERILLAEDDPHVRASVTGLLEEAGYRVVAAADGTEAVELFESSKDPLDGVVLDVVMPRMGGREALERIRSRHPSIPALLCTAHDPSAVTGTGSRVGDDVLVLRKPCKREELLDALRRVLDVRSSETAGAPLSS